MPSLAFASDPSRACVRCGKDLTDVASMEVGVGPICRKLDNALLAATIPANVNAARAAWAGVVVAGLDPMTVDTLLKVERDLFSAAAPSEKDWRKPVKRIEWVLSHKCDTESRTALCSLVEALGYVGLVAMWNGEAASGLATITFLDGRLWLVGPRNKAGKDALKAIPGRKFHPAEGTEKAKWSVPASAHTAFVMAVKKHWPNHEGLLKQVTQAIAWVENAKIIQNPAPVKAGPVVTLTVVGSEMWVKTPYNPNFVATVKTLPWKERRWDATEKVWWVAVKHLAWMKALLTLQYPGATVEVL